MENLLERLKRFKEEMAIPYKKIAEKCEIKPSTFYNFTGGLRDLQPDAAQRLDQFLKDRGY